MPVIDAFRHRWPEVGLAIASELGVTEAVDYHPLAAKPYLEDFVQITRESCFLSLKGTALLWVLLWFK